METGVEVKASMLRSAAWDKDERKKFLDKDFTAT
jgi:hypothetical protein